ncbi:MAG: ribonuclease E/G [Paracoccaceae bacterium]
MKGSVIALGHIGGAEVAARIIDGVLDDLLVSPPDGVAPAPGTIFRAITERPMKGQGGIMLRLPDGARAYLRGAKGLAEGVPLLVQVTSTAEPGKAAPVTTRILFKSRYAIVTPDAPGLNISRAIRDDEERLRLHDIAAGLMEGAGAGLILRSICEGADDDDIAADITAMRDLAAAVMGDVAGGPECLVAAPDAHELAWRDWGTPDTLADGPRALDDYGVLDAIDTLRQPRLDLPGGGYAFIEPTRALVAVDVNTGGDTSLAAGLKANIALARALPRALRCRGLGGQISLDLAPMANKERSQFEQVLRAALRADGIETVLAGWTPLGHFELQRKRERLPLSASLPP